MDRTHGELVRYLQVAGQPWREDESNRDTSYLRNFVRHRLMPLAAERNPGVARSVGAACDILGDEDAFMSQLAATALRSCTRREGAGLVVLDAARLAAAEVAIARRMVRLAVKRIASEARLEMRHVEAVLACVAAGEGSVALPEGVDARIEVVQRDIKDFFIPKEKGVVICNPPYGERLLDIKAAQEIYRTMGKVFGQGFPHRYYIISPDMEFESSFGRKADKRRKLYNGMIPCQLYMYFKG